jgi:lysophospholipase L1-like esterase
VRSARAHSNPSAGPVPAASGANLSVACVPVRWRPALASLAAVLVLVACDGNGAPDPSPDRGSTPTPVSGEAALDGLTLYAYGHSYLAGTATPQGRPPYLSLVAERFDMPVINRAVGGTTAAQIASRVLSASAWVPGSSGVVVVESVINDVASYGDDEPAVAAFSDSLELIVRTLCAGAKTEQSDESVTFGPGWVDGNRLADVSGGTAAVTSAPGAYADIAFAGDTLTVMTLRYTQPTRGGTIEIVDAGSGRVLARASATGGLPAGGALGYHEIGLTVDGFGPGPHTARVRKATGDTGPVWLDGYLTPSDTPPTVILVKGVPLNWAKRADGIATAEALAAYNDAVDAVARKFRRHVYTVDPARRLPSRVENYISSDGVHLNDRGHTLYAEALSDALLDAEFRPGPCAG